MDYGQVWNIMGNRTRHLRQVIEIGTPLVGDGSGIIEIILVEFLDEGRIAAKEVGGTEKLIHHSSYLWSGFLGRALKSRSN
jgi:hypothetical protein